MFIFWVCKLLIKVVVYGLPLSYSRTTLHGECVGKQMSSLRLNLRFEYLQSTYVFVCKFQTKLSCFILLKFKKDYFFCSYVIDSSYEQIIVTVDIFLSFLSCIFLNVRIWVTQKKVQIMLFFTYRVHTLRFNPCSSLRKREIAFFPTILCLEDICILQMKLNIQEGDGGFSK